MPVARERRAQSDLLNEAPDLTAFAAPRGGAGLPWGGPAGALTMYQYTAFDKLFVHQRAAQFRDQLERHLEGQLPDDDFRALRLQNGWYIQRHAPMLRIAVPYGELDSKQLRAFGRIAREYDRQIEKSIILFLYKV